MMSSHLLLLGHIIYLATAATIPTSQSDAVELQTSYGFGDLHLVNLDYGNFSNRAILRIQEDRYNPGSYFLMYLGFILKYTPGEPTSLFLGNPNQFARKSYVGGNSSVAEFSAVRDIVQYNRTKYALSDNLNNCVREYDSDTDTITPLIGDCSGTKTSVGFLDSGVKVAGDSNFLYEVLDIELVEPGNYFILCDQVYEQITIYDVVTKQVELLLRGEDVYSLSAPTSLLLNSDSTDLYVSHRNGLSKVNLDTREVTTLVGIGGYIEQTASLTIGTFDEAAIGPMASLTWIVSDKVLLASSDEDHALVVIDLQKKTVLASCVGSTEFNTSLEGSQESCRLNRPTAAAFSNNNTIYIAAVTEGGYGYFSDSSLFEINVDIDSYNHSLPGAVTPYTVTPDVVTTANSGTNSISSGIICPTCPVQLTVGNLEDIYWNLNGNPNRPIDFFYEDKFQPGKFYFNSGHLLLKYIPGQPVEHVVGRDYSGVSRKDIRYSAGNSTSAEFALVSSVAQVNETVMLIGDYLNNCVREYNMETDYIRQFVGNCSGTFRESHKLKAGDVSSPNKHFLSGLLRMMMIESRNYLLMVDLGYGLITKYDFSSKKVQLLGDDLYSSLPNPRDILLNADETELFVAHSFGLTRVNLDTLETTVVIGEAVSDLDGSGDIHFTPGPFATASNGYIETLQWVVPNRLIASLGTGTNEALLFFDLLGEQIYTTCTGSIQNNQTLVGPPGTCKLNAPTGMIVASDGTMYLATLRNVKYENYVFNTTSSVFSMKLKVSLCEFEAPTGNEIVNSSNSYYNQYDSITINCPPGMGLNSSSNIRGCVEDSLWNEPLPHCLEITSANAIIDLFPTEGQISGGTLVTASGIMPDSGIEVYLNNTDGQIVLLEHTAIPQQLSFQMTNQSRVGPAELIIKLTENVTKTYTFTYKEDPVLNYTIRSTTIVSGEFDAIFSVVNINSSSNYTLTTPSNGMSYPCTKNMDTVRCNLKKLTGDQVDNATSLSIQLLSDGLPLERSDNLTLTVYSDPVFVSDTITLFTGDTLKLSGYNLDVGVLNQYYNISIKLDSGATVSCQFQNVVNTTLQKVANTTLPNIANTTLQNVANTTLQNVANTTLQNVKNSILECLPLFIDGQKPTSEPKSIHVYLGDLHVNPENPVSAVFLPTIIAQTTPITALSSGSIAAIVIVTILCLVAVLIVLIVCYRRREAAQRLEEMRINSMIFSKENNEWFVSINVDLKARLDPLLIAPDSLKLKDGTPIGQGNFGTIQLGQMFSGDVVRTVAVKSLKGIDTPIAMIEKFLEEAVILQDFSHANVLQTLGVCIPESDTPQVILPYMANGDLKSLIQMEHMEFSIGDLMHFAKQIACGMEYLAANKFIHRDLAARNCLVSDKYIVRIADFGLSKDIYSNDYYRRDEKSDVALPVKWLALESLRTGKFSSESDVWSYGILMWELCTRGSQPYPDVDAWDVRAYLEEGRRLRQPSFSPPVIWEVMQSCWFEDAEERPTFTMIHSFLDKLLEGTECTPQSPYTYIREYTKDIPTDYVENAVLAETQDYLVPVSTKDRVLNDYLSAV